MHYTAIVNGNITNDSNNSGIKSMKIGSNMYDLKYINNLTNTIML